MDGKMKVAVIVGLITVAIASIAYVSSALGYMNGTVGKSRDSDMGMNRDKNRGYGYMQGNNETNDDHHMSQDMQDMMRDHCGH